MKMDTWKKYLTKNKYNKTARYKFYEAKLVSNNDVGIKRWRKFRFSTMRKKVGRKLWGF